MRLVAVAFLLSACIAVEERHGPGVTGSPDDVATPPGEYAGYRVVMPCAGTWADVGVTGTGQVEVTDADAIAAAGQDLKTRLVDLVSIWGWGGTGLACEPGIGTGIDLSDWRDVDTVIERTGAWLVENDYALQVGISVGGVPVPLASD